MTTTLWHLDTGSGSHAGAVLRAAVGLPGKALEAVAGWQERAAQRHHLMSVDRRVLADMGLTRANAVAEWSKPFWRA